MSNGSKLGQDNSGMAKQVETGANSNRNSSMRLPHQSEGLQSGIASLLERSKFSKQSDKAPSQRHQKMSVENSACLLEVRDQQTCKFIKQKLSSIIYPIKLNQGHGTLFSGTAIDAPLHLLFRPSYTN